MDDAQTPLVGDIWQSADNYVTITKGLYLEHNDRAAVVAALGFHDPTAVPAGVRVIRIFVDDLLKNYTLLTRKGGDWMAALVPSQPSK